MALYEQAYQMYTEAYTREVYLPDENGKMVLTLVRPEAVCNHRQLDVIFSSPLGNHWSTVLSAMRALVGVKGPSRDYSGKTTITDRDEKVEAFERQETCYLRKGDELTVLLDKGTLLFGKE